MRPTNLGIIGASLLITGIFIGWFGFPMFLKHTIKKQVVLTPGSVMRGMYEELPFPLDFKVYIFNVTNPDDVMKGATPIVNEIGPYVYGEHKDKVNTFDNEENDTLTYDLKTTWFFNQALSGKLTGNEMVTVPNLLLTSSVFSLAKTKPGMVNMVKKALDIVYKKPTSIFVTVTVKDLLFDGMPIDCSANDFAAKAFCTVLKTEVKNLGVFNETTYLFSVFGGANGTVGSTFTVKRGKENIRDLGLMLELNHQPKQNVWGDDKCDVYQGTDSTIFPPFLRPEEGLMAFSADICRSMPANYVEDLVYEKIPVRLYEGDLGDPSTDPDLKCFCFSETECTKQGAFDIMKCTGAPMIATLPHMYLTDDSYSSTVKGQNPTRDEHGIIVYFEPMTATPVYAKKRLQFNMPLSPVGKYPMMATLPEALLPIFWVEEGVELGDEFLKQLRQLFMLITAVHVLRWILIGSGAFLVLGSGYMFYKESTGYPVTPTNAYKSSPK